MSRQKTLLVLGAGEVGKTTIWKQLHHFFNAAYHTDSTEYTRIVRSNVLNSMQVLVQYARKKVLNFTPEMEKAAEEILSVDRISISMGDYDLQIGQTVTQLWQCEVIREAYQEIFFGKNICLHWLDCAKYFLDSAQRIFDDSYVPTQHDLLHAYVKSTGLSEIKLIREDTKYVFKTAGGQRSERRKWVKIFQHPSAIIFVASLAEYNFMLYENETTNRMLESIQLFEEMCQRRRHLDGIPIYLVLNKNDLFREKIERGVNITCAFPAYSGPCEYDACLDYIKERYKYCFGNQREVNISVTSAIDSSSIFPVFDRIV